MHRSVHAAVALLVLGSVLPAQAQSDLDDARAQRDALRQEAAETASQIDELEAEDADIVEALERIDTWIATQEARLASAEQELQVKREAESDANARAAQLEQQIVDLEAQVAAQLVDGYVEGFQRNDELLLRADDINLIPILRFVLDESAGTSVSATDLLRLARSEQADAVAEAEQASADAAAITASIVGQIEDLDESRAAQERLRAEVASRIDVLETEAAVLADEDAQITSFILAEEERIRREAEERRRAEEEARRRAEAERLRQEEEERQRQLEEERQRELEERAAEEPEEEPQPDEDEAEAPEEEGEAEAPEEEGEADDQADEPAPEPEPDTSGEVPNFSHPISGPISSGFGNRVHPIYGTVRFHAGLDYGAPSGAPIGSSAPGTVIFVGTFSGYGNTVMVQHTGGYTTLYAHMSGFNVSNGASVGTGDTLGFVGSTGLSTGPHLHFEIRLNGTAIDPAPLL